MSRPRPKQPSSPGAGAIESGVFRTTVPKSILIADHDAGSRCLLAEVLAVRYRVYEAADGLQATRLLRTMPIPAAILCEVELPIFDGLELVNLVRRQPRLRAVPIVFLSERASSEDISRGVFAGVRRYIVKPFLPNAVFDTVTNIIGSNRGECTRLQETR